jgi:hypothetical protein
MKIEKGFFKIESAVSKHFWVLLSGPMMMDVKMLFNKVTLLSKFFLLNTMVLCVASIGFYLFIFKFN